MTGETEVQGKGQIILEMDNCSPKDLDRIRHILKTIILCGGLNVRNGNITLHFDNEGVLQKIDAHTMKFRRQSS